MSEAIRATKGVINEEVGQRHPPTEGITAMGNAFKGLVKKLGGEEEGVDVHNVSQVLRDRGVVVENKTADIMSFPFKKTEEAQRELGREVGSTVKNIIEEHQNRNGNSSIGDTISHMTPEKLPQNHNESGLEAMTGGVDAKSLREEIVRLNLERSKIMNDARHRKPTEEERAALNSITERMVTAKDKLSSLLPKERAVTEEGTEIEGVVAQKAEEAAVAEPTDFVQEKNNAATPAPDQQSPVEGFPPVSAFEQIKKEISELKQKKEEILKNIRDHTTITGYVEEANKVNRQIEELENTLRNPAKLNQQEIKGIDAITPDSATHVKATGEIIPSSFEKVIMGIKSEDSARAERLLKTIGANPEQRERIEKLLGATQTFTEKTEAIEKEKDPWVVERASKIGEWYRKLPLKYKLVAAGIFWGAAGISAMPAMVGGAGIGMIMGAAFAGSTGQRFLGSLAMFATVEGVLTKRSLARNEEEEKILGMRMNVILGVLAGSGVFFGGKLLGDYLSTHVGSGVGEKIVDQAKVPPPIPESAPGISTPEIPTPALNEAVENSAQPAQNEYAQKVAAVRDVLKSETLAGTGPVEHVLKPGEGVWKAATAELERKGMLDGLNEGHRTYIIDAVKDWYAANNPGVDIDHLKAGDAIRLDIINDKVEMAKIFEKAGALSPDQVENIVNNNQTIAELNGEIDHITTTQPDGLAEITKDYTLSMPDTGGKTIEQLSAEALSMDTDAVLHDDVQYMFGSKGLFDFGFLGTNGERSIDWLDFKGRPVSEIMSKKFEGMPLGDEGGVQKFGIDSYGAVDKMKKYMQMLIEKAGGGISPEPSESVEHFSKRAISAIISKKQ